MLLKHEISSVIAGRREHHEDAIRTQQSNQKDTQLGNKDRNNSCRVRRGVRR